MARIALDFTPGRVQLAGIGRYTRELARELATILGPDLIVWSGLTPGRAVAEPPIGCRFKPLPIPASWLTRLWYRLHTPLPIEFLIGPVDLVHGTDFVVPPARCPRVVTIHDLSFLLVPELGHPRLVRYLSAIVPRMIRDASLVITVSEAVRQDLLRLFRIEPDRVVAIHHGAPAGITVAPTDQVRPMLAAYGIRQPYVLAVGTVEPRKGYLTLLEALKRLASRNRDVQVVIVGSTGWLAEPIEAEIERAVQIDLAVRLHRVTDELLATLYRSAAVFVTASRYEGFNLPLLEALSTGTPAVATAVPAHREVAGPAALYVPIDAPDELADAIRAILESPALAAQLREAALTRAQLFSWRKSALRHLDVYSRALMERGLEPPIRQLDCR